MATLSGTTLTNCFYIPDFVPAGTKTAFENTDPPTAPTSWVKDTSLNNCTLRVVTGSVTSSLLNQGFSTVLTNRTIPISVADLTSGANTTSSNPIGATVQPALAANNISPISPSIFAAAPHVHSVPGAAGENLRAPGGPNQPIRGSMSTQLTGGNGVHNHGYSTGDPGHSHGLPGNHIHPTTESPHTHTSSAAQDFSVNYRDLIIATKQ